jgi:hypothetical protein
MREERARDDGVTQAGVEPGQTRRGIDAPEYSREDRPAGDQPAIPSAASECRPGWDRGKLPRRE